LRLTIVHDRVRYQFARLNQSSGPSCSEIMHASVSSMDIQKARRSARRKRASIACDRCKVAKVKCSDYRPCKNCQDSDSKEPCSGKRLNVPQGLYDAEQWKRSSSHIFGYSGAFLPLEGPADDGAYNTAKPISTMFVANLDPKAQQYTHENHLFRHPSLPAGRFVQAQGLGLPFQALQPPSTSTSAPPRFNIPPFEAVDSRRVSASLVYLGTLLALSSNFLVAPPLPLPDLLPLHRA
jgi:hypothetical protein